MVRNVIQCVQRARMINMKANKDILLNVFQSNFHLDSVRKEGFDFILPEYSWN